MAISFNETPSATRVPFVFVEFDNANAVQGAQAQAYKALMIGQRLSSGTIAKEVITRVTSVEQAKTYFGAGSMLAEMIEAYLANDKITELWAIAADDDAAGVKSAGAFTFSGTATASGTIALYVGGKKINVAVSAGDGASAIATAAAAALEALVAKSFDAAVDGVATTKVNVTYKHKGVVGNFLDLRVAYADEELPAGITVAITAMTGGTTNPTLTSLIAAIPEEHYNVLAFPYTDTSSLTAIEAELLERFGPLKQLDGVAFSASNVSHGSLGTLGNARNSQHLSIMASTGSPTPVWQVAAAVSAVAAYYGSIDPARPFQTLVLKGVLAPKPGARFTTSERNLLLYDGISTMFVDAGGLSRVERLITTYKTNALGADDPSYLDVNTLLTLGYIRWDFRNYFKRKYPRHKLANDGTRFGAGQAVITPKLAKAECLVKFRQWEELGLVEGFDQFKADLIVERNVQDPNRLDILMPPDLINQLITTACKIDFRV